MNYKYFLTYNVIGAFCWIASFITLGYLFGNMPIVKDNFTYLIFGIIILSVLPGVIGLFAKNSRKNLLKLYTSVGKPVERRCPHLFKTAEMIVQLSKLLSKSLEKTCYHRQHTHHQQQSRAFI